MIKYITPHNYLKPEWVGAEQEGYDLLIRQLKVMGIPTGSRCWGVNHDHSDLDYIVKYRDIAEFVDMEAVKCHASGTSTGGSAVARASGPLSIKITVQTDNTYTDLDIIICTTDGQYTCWANATHMMHDLVNQGGVAGSVFRRLIRDKECRVKIFEKLRTIPIIPGLETLHE